MPSRARGKAAVYGTPTIRNGGLGYLQVEAIHNRPMSIARRHLAASELRMRGIEPNELSSSEWVRFLIMETMERERWIASFEKRRRDSDASNSSVNTDRETAMDKAEEARLEAEEAAREERRTQEAQSSMASAGSSMAPGRTPSVSVWARQFDAILENESNEYSARRTRNGRRAGSEGVVEAPPPPTYENALKAGPPPAYEPRSDDDEPASRPSPPRVRFDV